MKTCMWIAAGVVVVGGIGVYMYMRSKKKSGTDSTASTIIPPAPLDQTKTVGTGITKQTVAPRIPTQK